MSAGVQGWDPTVNEANGDDGYGPLIGTKQSNGGVILQVATTGGGSSVGTDTTPNVSVIKDASTNTHAIVTATGAVKTDGSGVTQPISVASLPLPTGAATDTTVAGVTTSLGTDGTSPPALPGGSTGVRGWLRYIGSLLTGTIAVSNASLPLPTGAATQATLANVLSALQGTLTAAISGSVAVTGTFWQAVQPVSSGGGTAALSSVAASLSSVPLFAAASATRKRVIYLDSTSGNLYVAFAATATTSAFTYKLTPGATLEIDYQGAISGIWDAASGNARLTQITA